MQRMVKRGKNLFKTKSHLKFLNLNYIEIHVNNEIKVYSDVKMTIVENYFIFLFEKSSKSKPNLTVLLQ